MPGVPAARITVSNLARDGGTVKRCAAHGDPGVGPWLTARRRAPHRGWRPAAGNPDGRRPPPLPAVDPSEPSRDRGPQAAPAAPARATGPPRRAPYRPEPPSRRPLPDTRTPGPRAVKGGTAAGGAQQSEVLLTARGGDHAGGKEDATTRGAAAPPERHRERWGLWPVPSANAHSATGIPRVAPPTPPRGRTAGTTTAGARRDAHRPRVAGWGARSATTERGGAWRGGREVGGRQGCPRD
jgi:hypothetical protein